MPIAQNEATTLLDSLFRAAAYTAPPAVYVALATSAPTATTPGTEVTGGSYARQQMTCGSAASAGSIANTAALTYTAMPVATVTHVDLYTTSSGTTRRLWYGQLAAPKTTASGDTLSFAIGAITAAIN